MGVGLRVAVEVMEFLLLLSLICSIADASQHHTTIKREAAVPYLPYLTLDAAVQVLPAGITDTDICSDRVEIPGGLPFGDIRTPNLSVCENGVILTEPSLLRSFLCVCRGEFGQCRDPGESLYLIAPFWSDVNNISATQGTTISYQIFEEGNTSHTQTLESVWSYIDTIMPDGTQFFPVWMMVAHWSNVHPYIRPNVIDPRTNTFQAIVVTDGTQTYAIFTYNCSDLDWARTNSLVAADCSFIGCYAGGNFDSYLSETDLYALQIDSRTVNISKAASCSNDETMSWNNFLFYLTPQSVVNVTAREQQINARIGESVVINFSISTFRTEVQIGLWFTPQCQCSGPIMPYTFTCNSTEHRVTMEGVNITIFCSAARVKVTVGNVTQQAFGDYAVSISNSDNETEIDRAISSLKQIEETISGELPSDPSTLTSDNITSASTILEQLEESALTNEIVRQDYLATIDNLMQADGESIIQSQINSNSSSRILNSLEQFTLQLKLPSNTSNETFIFESYAFQLFDIDSETFNEQTISADLGPRGAVKNLMIPVNISFSSDIERNATLYVQVNDAGNDDPTYRLSVVVYRQENLFLNDTNGTEDTISSAVVTVTSMGSNPRITMGFQSIRNTTFETTRDSVEYQEVCSNFNTGGNGGRGSWTGDNCEEIPCSTSDGNNYTCCECHTFGHFGLLLAVTPVVLEDDLEVVLVVFSYLGASISILCLVMLLTTYTLSKKLRSSTSGKLLINLGASLLGIYVFFIVSGHIRPYGDTVAVDIICGLSSALLQYFMLVYFGWTAAEALNLYFSLVKVFEARVIKSYTLKAGLIVWLVPLVIVAVSGGAGSKYYINDVYCRPVQWPFYFAFLLPIAVILIFDCVMFMRIMVSLYEHTKQTIRLKDNKDERLSLKQIKQNAYYAIVLVTLFGIGWTFGLIVTGYPNAPMGVTFTLQLLFCIFVSSQGFLLFLFQVIFSRDSRDFWLNQLGKCFPSLRSYNISKRMPIRKKKTTRIMKKFTGLLRAPKTSELAMTQSQENFMTGTMERGEHMHTGFTESFEVTSQTSTLPRTLLASPTSVGSGTSTENLTSNIASGNFEETEIDFENMSLQDDF